MSGRRVLPVTLGLWVSQSPSQASPLGRSAGTAPPRVASVPSTSPRSGRSAPSRDCGHSSDPSESGSSLTGTDSVCVSGARDGGAAPPFPRPDPDDNCLVLFSWSSCLYTPVQYLMYLKPAFKDTLSQVYFFGQILSVRPVQVLFQLSPATPHGCHGLRESVSRA